MKNVWQDPSIYPQKLINIFLKIWVKHLLEAPLHFSKDLHGKSYTYYDERCHQSQSVKQISLNDYKDKYLLLFFYPLDFTFVCPTEILEFSKRSKDFKGVNTEVLGCSIDSVFSHRKWSETPRDQGGLGGLEI